MKRSLRVTLLTILIGLTILTTALLGVSSYINTRSTSQDLTDQILEQTSARIDHQINDLVDTATGQGNLSRHLYDARLIFPTERGHRILAVSTVGLFASQPTLGSLAAVPLLALDPRDPQPLLRFWLEVLDVYPDLSGIVVTLEQDGLTLLVSREPERPRPIVQRLRPLPLDGGVLLESFHGEDYPHTPFAHSVRKPDFDQRGRPWYSQAKAKKRPGWTDTYVFFNENGDLTYPGVSYSVPLFRGGELRGVLGVDLHVFNLCDFLKKLKVSEHGTAFVVEVQADGTRKLIAHPDRAVVLPPQEGGTTSADLVPIERLRDRFVPAFMAQVPADVDPLRLKQLQPVRFTLDGVNFIGGYRGLEDDDSPRWLICILLPEHDVTATAELNNKISLAVGAGVLILAILLSLVTAAQVARPLEKLAREFEAVALLDIEPRPVHHSVVSEVDRLAVVSEDMKTSLRSFRKYVPADLVCALLRSGKEAVLGGERRVLTIYFADIANFTTISEEMDPEKLVEHLGGYLQILSDEILATGGTVDKYIGDAIMAFWGAPSPAPQHALAACTAAVRNQQTLQRLRLAWQEQGKPPFHARIGINTGEVIVGNIGSAVRLNYTVIGDAVNLASRLEGLNKYYGTSTLISEFTHDAACAGIVARALDWVSVKGKSKGVLVYELIGLKGEVSREAEAFAELSTQALLLYRGRQWSEALRRFEELRQQRPDDVPARVMSERCAQYQSTPPAEDWDGVHHMESK